MAKLYIDESIKQQIAKSIGPAPWYWNTFPEFIDSEGNKLAWSFSGTEGSNAYLVSLSHQENLDKLKVVLNTYTRAFFISPRYLGLWFTWKGLIRIKCIDLEFTSDFILNGIPESFKENKEPYYIQGKPVSEFNVDSALDEGSHSLIVPDEFKAMKEILIVVPYQVSSEDDAAYAIFAIKPMLGIVEVFPQKWFTPKKFDIGYEWITRVTRDQDTGRFIGDGIRIGSFELDGNGTDLLRFI